MKILLLITALVIAQNGRTQTLEEWTAQKETQIRYLTEQIAALKVYTNYIQKGYSIAKTGLNAVSAIKEEDKDQHKNFFESLRIVNPGIIDLKTIEAIISLQKQTIEYVSNSLKQATGNNFLQKHELIYAQKVYNNLINNSYRVIDELTKVTTDKLLEMHDNERIRWINKLFSEMQNINTASRSFGQSLQLLALQRTRDHKNIRRTQSLYDVTNR